MNNYAPVTERPTSRVQLKSLAQSPTVTEKEWLDATPDLIELNSDCIEISDRFQAGGYCVFCKDTLQIWFAHNEECLNKNFVYRHDLIIKKVYSYSDVADFWKEHMGDYKPGMRRSKQCFIIDLPMNETYEVYYNPSYPSMRYGKSNPKGSYILKFKNRFHRDMAIMELDKRYSESSFKCAGKFTGKHLKANEAIIISDGSMSSGKIASSVYYLDSTSVIHMTEGGLPSLTELGSTIAEIKAATNALELCYAKGKSDVTYYYDNTSILNILKNRRTEYVQEIRSYKDTCEKLNGAGIKINFVELHPKTGENRDSENKALMWFHNECDAACTSMCDLIEKDIKNFASNGNVDGIFYSDIKMPKRVNKERLNKSRRG